MKKSNLKKYIGLLALFNICGIPLVFAVKTEAKTSTAAKAKKTYAKYLSQSTQNWGEAYILDTAKCEFALKDFNNDGVPELILFKKSASISESFERVYGYHDGKVQELFNIYSGSIKKIYPSKGICIVTGCHTGGYWDYVYKITSKSCKIILERNARDDEGIPLKYKHYQGKKKITKKKYNQILKKTIGNAKSSNKYTYRKNSKKNRDKYLAKEKTVINKKNYTVFNKDGKFELVEMKVAYVENKKNGVRIYGKGRVPLDPLENVKSEDNIVNGTITLLGKTWQVKTDYNEDLEVTTHYLYEENNKDYSYYIRDGVPYLMNYPIPTLYDRSGGIVYRNVGKITILVKNGAFIETGGEETYDFFFKAKDWKNVWTIYDLQKNVSYRAMKD